MYDNLNFTRCYQNSSDLLFFVFGTGTDATDQPWATLAGSGSFSDIFDKNKVLKIPKEHDILSIIIKNFIKQPDPVGAGLSNWDF